jgi:hypothetical protein
MGKGGVIWLAVENYLAFRIWPACRELNKPDIQYNLGYMFQPL